MYDQDVYYNANETIVAAVAAYIENKYNVQTESFKGYLFVDAENELHTTITQELDHVAPYHGGNMEREFLLSSSALSYVNGEISLEEALIPFETVENERIQKEESKALDEALGNALDKLVEKTGKSPKEVLQMLVEAKNSKSS
ncbi:TPA: hypothetical protein ACPVZ9_001522 [Vibrio parahaemolyticus]